MQSQLSAHPRTEDYDDLQGFLLALVLIRPSNGRFLRRGFILALFSVFRVFPALASPGLPRNLQLTFIHLLYIPIRQVKVGIDCVCFHLYVTLSSNGNPASITLALPPFDR